VPCSPPEEPIKCAETMPAVPREPQCQHCATAIAACAESDSSCQTRRVTSLIDPASCHVKVNLSSHPGCPKPRSQGDIFSYLVTEKGAFPICPSTRWRRQRSKNGIKCHDQGHRVEHGAFAADAENKCSQPLISRTGPSDSVRPSHRRPLLCGKRASRE
jgi:hypothetical protein